MLPSCPTAAATTPVRMPLSFYRTASLPLCKEWVKHPPSFLLQHGFGNRFPRLGRCSAEDHMATAGRNYQAWICCQGFSGMQLLLSWWHRMVEELLGLAVHPPHPQVRLRTLKVGLDELACRMQGVSPVWWMWDGESILQNCAPGLAHRHMLSTCGDPKEQDQFANHVSLRWKITVRMWKA